MDEPVTLLVVEDNELDVERIERLVRRLDLANPIAHVYDGLEALELLRGTHPKQQLITPFVILLDLNMPRMNGYEFLAELRSDLTLKESQVVVLSTSDAAVDIERTARLGVSNYLTKPISPDQLLELLDR